MGASQSKSEAIVNSLVDAGISVVKNTMSKTSTPITNINELDLTGCDGIVIDGLIMKNYAHVDVQSMIAAVSSTDVEQNIAKVMEAKAKSDSIAGLGLSSAQSKAVINSVTTLSAALSESISNMADASLTQMNRVSCGGAKNAIIKKVDMENKTEVFLKQVTESESVTSAKQKVKEELEAAGVSKAKGLDPTAMFAMGMIALVVVVAFFVFGGIGFAAQTLLSSSFWMLASGVASMFLIYTISSKWTGLWPQRKMKPTLPADATPEQVAAKKAADDEVKAYNKMVIKASAILLPIAALATVVFGVVVAKTTRPAPIRQYNTLPQPASVPRMM